MNLVEDYIVKVISEEDITEQFERETNIKAKEPLIEVCLISNCYGHEREHTRIFSKSEWDTAKQKGYFLS